MIVLDANILVRAILGRRVRQLLETYAAKGVRFFSPDVAFRDAAKYLPQLLQKRGHAADGVTESFKYLRTLVERVTPELYAALEDRRPPKIARSGRKRLAGAGSRAGTILFGLDGGCGLLWHRHRSLDHESRRDFPRAVGKLHSIRRLMQDSAELIRRRRRRGLGLRPGRDRGRGGVRARCGTRRALSGRSR